MLDDLKRLLGLEGIEDDSLLEFVLNWSAAQITQYCGLEQLPDELAPTAVCLAADIWREKGYGRETKAAEVAEIKRGDVFTRFAAAGGEEAGQILLERYAVYLQPFRKLRW